jgi:hypothetical protein
LALFELVRVPETLQTVGFRENKYLAYAELVSHIAFLKTIPAPPFNSIYNI